MTTPELTRLLVPLDGSRLAEAVLPAVEILAARFGAQVTLIHVMEKRPPTHVHGDRHLVNAAEAESYLRKVENRLRPQGIEVRIEVHGGPEEDIAQSVVEHAEEFAPDLLILCTHGHQDLGRLLFGSIALQVLQRGTRPLLLIQPEDDGTAPAFAPRHILVPLDGKQEHESAISMALLMAHAFGSELDLVFVVPTLGTLPSDRSATATLLPATTRALLDLDQQQAADYLQRVSDQCRTAGLAANAHVLRGDTVTELVQYAERVGCDLIAMPSHGRVGLKALLAGSVTRRISAKVKTPLLLVRDTGE